MLQSPAAKLQHLNNLSISNKGTVCERGGDYGEVPSIRSCALPQKPLRLFGNWNRFNGFNQPVTTQLEKGDVGRGREIRLKRGGWVIDGPTLRDRKTEWEKKRNRKMTGWSGGFSRNIPGNVFSASPCHREIIPCWVVSLSSVGASVRVHRLGKQKSLRGFIWLGCRGGRQGEVRIGGGQLSHFVSQVGVFHSGLKSWRGGHTLGTGSEWTSSGFPISDNSKLGTPCYPSSLLYSKSKRVYSQLPRAKICF